MGGYTRINMDDCWEACERGPNGEIQADAERFPSGIKALAATLHSYGFQFGLYTSAGSTTCSGGTRPNCKPPGSVGHYTDDAKTFAAWDIDYVKLDWCGSDLTNASQQHTAFSQALNATDRPIWLELCRGYGYPPPPYVAEVAQSWRIMGDHHDDWQSTAKAIAQSAGQSKMSGPGNWAYNDFLMTGGQGCADDTNPNVSHAHCPGMSDVEYVTEFSLWAIIASPLIVATDVRNMTQIMSTVLLNEEVLAVNQNNEFAAGDLVESLTTDCDANVSDACQVWTRQIASNEAAIVLYNAGDEAHEVTVVFEEVPGVSWASKNQIELRDLWAKETMGYWVMNYTKSIEPHGVQFLRAVKQ